MVAFSPYEKQWFCNEWRSACHIVKKGEKKKGVDLSKMELFHALLHTTGKGVKKVEGKGILATVEET